MARKSMGPRILGRGLLLAVLAAALYILKDRAPQGSLPERPAPAGTASPAAPVDALRETQPLRKSPADSITIASWNIEWLGKPADRSGPARGRAQDPSEIAECIASTGASIVALEEIIATGGETPLRSTELDAVSKVLSERTRGIWEYVLFSGRRSGDQLTGLMWNASLVSALDASGGNWDSGDVPFAVPFKAGRSAQGNSLWSRPPNAMKFSAGPGKTDIVLIVVHMKADYQGDFSAHRAEEASALVDALGAVRSAFKDEDIVVLGDTNCVQQVEPALETFARAGLRDLNAKNEQTHWRGGAMDRILVSEGQPEFSSARFSVASDRFLEAKRWTPEDFKRSLSDHYLVFATITVADDDD